MIMTIDKEMQETKLTVFNERKEVFSGRIRDLENFFSSGANADRIKICNAAGLEVALMNGRDFEQLLEEDPEA